MTHVEWQERIDRYDDLTDVERRELEEHIGQCAECARGWQVAHTIAQAARELPRELAPPGDDWRSLRAALVGAERKRSRARLPAAALLAAVVAAIAAVTIVVRHSDTTGRTGGGPAPSNDDMTATAVHAGLARECMGAGRSLQAVWPAVPQPAEAGIDTALAILDRSIAETRTALAAEPGDGALADLLTDRYRQKLSLLQATLRRAEST